jgi:predicted ATPase
VAEGSLVLLQLGLTAHWAAVRVVQLLDGIQVHVPFEVRPHWQLHERALGESPRRRVKAHTVSRLDRYGFNLANCLMNLRNRRESWDALLLELRVVLGQHFTDFHLFVDNGFQVVRPVFDGIERDLDVLSEGQLGYLLHCVMLRLPPTGVVAIDEPELHLHPSMVARLAWRFEFAAESRCVLVATHSATFLDQLTEPAKSVYVCRLREADSAMEIVRLDAVRLQEWLTDYRGVGELADTGHLVHVLEQAATPTESPRGAAE